MNTENKEKAMLADDLTAYIRDKHTQEECIGFIDGYNMALSKLKLLSICRVMPCISHFLDENDKQVPMNDPEVNIGLGGNGEGFFFKGTGNGDDEEMIPVYKA